MVAPIMYEAWARIPQSSTRRDIREKQIGGLTNMGLMSKIHWLQSWITGEDKARIHFVSKRLYARELKINHYLAPPLCGIEREPYHEVSYKEDEVTCPACRSILRREFGE
jgi:hypothetical protein